MSLCKHPIDSFHSPNRRKQSKSKPPIVGGFSAFLLLLGLVFLFMDMPALGYAAGGVGLMWCLIFLQLSKK